MKSSLNRRLSPRQTAAMDPTCVQRAPWPRIALLLLLAAMASQAACAQSAPVCPTHKPVTLTQVIGLVAQKVADDRIVQRIQACQLDFQLDAPTLDKLSAARASDAVMDAINQITAARLTSEQAHAQIADLQSRADAASKAGREHAATGYRARAAFLEQSSYSDPRPLAYLRYNADTLQLAISIGSEEYWFDKVPPASAQTLKANLPKAKVTVSFVDDGQRTLTLDSGNISLTGIPRKAAEEAELRRVQKEIASHLDRAQDRIAHRDFDAAIAECKIALALDPNNVAAKTVLVNAEEKQREVAAEAESNRAKGVWVDRQSQLMWTINDDGHDINWNDASAYCQSLRIANFSDWRLPEQLELSALFDPDSNRQTPPLAKSFLYMYNGAVTKAAVGTTWTYHIHGGIQLTNTEVWTSVKEDSGSGSKAVMIDFQDGKSYRGLLNGHSLRRVLCVRPTGQPPASPVETAQSTAGAEPTPEMLKPSEVPSATRDTTKQARVLFDQKRYAEALPLVQKSCSAGDPEGCAMLGGMYFFGWGLPQDKPRGEVLAGKACDVGDGEACDSMGDAFYWGMGTPKDYPRSVGLYTKSCDAGFAMACANLARSYLFGNGVAQDRQQAQNLYSKSCNMGYAKGCGEAQKIH